MSFSWHEEVLEGATPAWTGLKDGVKHRSANALHIVQYRHSSYDWATIREHCSGLERLSVCSDTVFIMLLPSAACF